MKIDKLKQLVIVKKTNLCKKNVNIITDMLISSLVKTLTMLSENQITLD